MSWVIAPKERGRGGEGELRLGVPPHDHVILFSKRSLQLGPTFNDSQIQYGTCVFGVSSWSAAPLEGN